MSLLAGRTVQNDICCYFPKGGQMLETEMSGVSALVTLFSKEHDRIAKKLKHFNKLWNSDRLFQEVSNNKTPINSK